MAWTAPKTWTTGELVTAAMMNIYVSANDTYLKTETDKLDDVSQTQPARALDTIYQNGSKIRIITIYVTLDASETASLQVLSSSPPTTIVARTWNGTGQAADIGASMSAVILPNYYYRLASTLGTPTIGYWTEWDLH